MAGKDLVQIIRDNPGCIATIDNDGWWINSKEDPHGDPIVSDSDIAYGSLGDGGYGSGNSYGGDILQALAIIVGIKVESV